MVVMNLLWLIIWLTLDYHQLPKAQTLSLGHQLWGLLAVAALGFFRCHDTSQSVPYVILSGSSIPSFMHVFPTQLGISHCLRRSEKKIYQRCPIDRLYLLFIKNQIRAL